jgi:hypothetical protein
MTAITTRGRKRFFSSVTGYFDQTYAGRYFGVILAELARIEPASLLRILDAAGLKLPDTYIEALLDGKLVIDLEWWFPDKSRRADLALYLEKSHPILLAEVKVEDGLSERQLDDYISFVKRSKSQSETQLKHQTQFLFLSRYAPLLKDAKVLQVAVSDRMPVGELRHGQLHQILDGCGDTVTRMLREYLEDVGMTYQNIDLKKDRMAIIHMGSRILGMDNAGHGRVRSHSSIDLVPNLMERFFGNIEVLATLTYTTNRKIFGNRFRRDFLADRVFDMPKRVRARSFSNKPKARITESEKEKDVLESLFVTGGTLWFYSSGRFICPKKRWAYLSIGCYVEMEASKKPDYGLFAEFEWSGGSDVEWDKRASYETFSKFPNESSAQQMLWRILRTAQTKAKREAPPPYRTIFERFVV